MFDLFLKNIKNINIDISEIHTSYFILFLIIYQLI